MTNPSPHPNSFSPKDQPKSAFQWPAPFSQDTTITSNSDIPLKDILERYKDDPEILKYVLIAKAEEDKRQAAKDVLKTEQARVHVRQLDLEYLREQNRLPSRYHHQDKNQYPLSATTTAPVPVPVPGYHHHPTLPPPPQPQHPTSTSSSSQNPYYGLAPVQQQVLARITGNSDINNYSSSSSYSSPYDYQPSSPVSYPHSAHPLCPPSTTTTTTTIASDTRSSNNNNLNNNNSNSSRYNQNSSTAISTTTSSSSSSLHLHQRLQHPSSASSNTQSSIPISPAIANNSNNISNKNSNTNNNNNNNDDTTRYKRNRYSVSEPYEDKISHNKVMEALKAKIQRGNGSPVSTTPPTSLPYRANNSSNSSNNSDSSLHIDKRQRQLPKLNIAIDNNNNNTNNNISNNINNTSSSSLSSSSSSSSSNGITGTAGTVTHTPSPRSAKPILPPIDTSIGRHPLPPPPSHHHQRHSSCSSSSSPSPPPMIKQQPVSPSDQLLAIDPKRQDRVSSKTSFSTSPSNDSNQSEQTDKVKSSDSD